MYLAVTRAAYVCQAFDVLAPPSPRRNRRSSMSFVSPTPAQTGRQLRIMHRNPICFAAITLALAGCLTPPDLLEEATQNEVALKGNATKLGINPAPPPGGAIGGWPAPGSSTALDMARLWDMDVTWAQIEPSPPVDGVHTYVWDRLDKLMDQIIAFDMRPMNVIGVHDTLLTTWQSGRRSSLRRRVLLHAPLRRWLTRRVTRARGILEKWPMPTSLRADRRNCRIYDTVFPARHGRRRSGVRRRVLLQVGSPRAYGI